MYTCTCIAEWLVLWVRICQTPRRFDQRGNFFKIWSHGSFAGNITILFDGNFLHRFCPKPDSCCMTVFFSHAFQLIFLLLNKMWWNNTFLITCGIGMWYTCKECIGYTCGISYIKLLAILNMRYRNVSMWYSHQGMAKMLLSLQNQTFTYVSWISFQSTSLNHMYKIIMNRLRNL